MDYEQICNLNKNAEIGTVCIKINQFNWVKEDKKEQSDKLLSHIVRICTEAWLFSQQNGFDCFNVSVDANNIKMRHLDKKFAQQLSVTLQQLFPERLNCCKIYNAPKIFKTFYEVIKLFIDKRTRKKIVIVKNPIVDLEEGFVDHNQSKSTVDSDLSI